MVAPVVFISGTRAPLFWRLPAQQWGERQAIALSRYRLADHFGNRRHDVHIFGVRIDGCSHTICETRIANDAKNVVTLLEEAELFFQPVVTKLFAVIGRHDDHGVVPFATCNEGIEDASKLLVDVANHAVVLRAQLTHRTFISGGRCHWELQGKVVERVARIGCPNRHFHVSGVIGAGPLTRSRIWRMWSKITRMREPRCVLLIKPPEETVGKKR